MIPGDEFPQPAFGLGEQHEVFSEVQQSIGLARAAQHRRQRDDATLLLAFDLFPIGEVFPLRREAAHDAAAAVGQDDEDVVPE